MLACLLLFVAMVSRSGRSEGVDLRDHHGGQGTDRIIRYLYM